MIRRATPADAPALREIERAAGEPFRELGLDVVADDEPPPRPAMRRDLPLVVSPA
ncbi:hypothetical protein [Pseudonocardia sp. NPDC049635]|uniref:hypothetical protein n=1 Tax=Pseudonocardia sp. NPDC049635 TaxID=3155506 RepID=UPI0033C756C8